MSNSWPLNRPRLSFQLGDVDPDDLLSFLDPPPDLSTPPSSGSGMSNSGPGESSGQGSGFSQQAQHPCSNSNESNNPNSNLTDEEELLSLIDYDWNFRNQIWRHFRFPKFKRKDLKIGSRSRVCELNVWGRAETGKRLVLLFNAARRQRSCLNGKEIVKEKLK